MGQFDKQSNPGASPFFGDGSVKAKAEAVEKVGPVGGMEQPMYVASVGHLAPLSVGPVVAASPVHRPQGVLRPYEVDVPHTLHIQARHKGMPSQFYLKFDVSLAALDQMALMELMGIEEERTSYADTSTRYKVLGMADGAIVLPGSGLVLVTADRVAKTLDGADEGSDAEDSDPEPPEGDEEESEEGEEDEA